MPYERIVVSAGRREDRRCGRVRQRNPAGADVLCHAAADAQPELLALHRRRGFARVRVWDDEWSDKSHSDDARMTNSFLSLGAWMREMPALPADGPRFQFGSFVSIANLGNNRAGRSQRVFALP